MWDRIYRRLVLRGIGSGGGQFHAGWDLQEASSVREDPQEASSMLDRIYRT